MPTLTERDYYSMGFEDGYKAAMNKIEVEALGRKMGIGSKRSNKPKRKLSAWQKYIKNKRNHIKYRDGKLNLKKMGVAFRRKQRR
jgi:hypothetical protein